jgi:hypothetical protein
MSRFILRNDSLSTNIEAKMSGPHICIINCFRQALTPRLCICDFKNALLDGNRITTEINLLVCYCKKCQLLQLHQPATCVRGCENNNTTSTAFLFVRLCIFFDCVDSFYSRNVSDQLYLDQKQYF